MSEFDEWFTWHIENHVPISLYKDNKVVENAVFRRMPLGTVKEEYISIQNDLKHTPVIVSYNSNLERSEFRIDPDNFVLRPNERMACKLLFAPKVREYSFEPGSCLTARPIFSEDTMMQARSYFIKDGLAESAKHYMKTNGDNATVWCLTCGDANEYMGLPVEESEIKDFLDSHQCITQELIA